MENSAKSQEIVHLDMEEDTQGRESIQELVLKKMLERKDHNSWIDDSVKDLTRFQNDSKVEFANLQLQINQLLDGQARILANQNILIRNQKNPIMDCVKARQLARVVDRKVSVLTHEHGVSTVKRIKEISDTFYDGFIERYEVLNEL